MANPLVLDNVMKQFGEKTAVNNISLQVEEGEIYGLLGANGAGKTTTMRMVLGLIYPDGGKILYNGKPYGRELQAQMGYLPEERGLYPKVKVSDQIIYLARLRGMSSAEADKSLKYWLDRFEVPEYYDKKIEELSKGNQQKMGFIAAVVHKPKIVIMDEAFSGLDPVNVELLKATVKELRDQGTSILFSTHRMEHVEELCRNITILHRSNTVLQGNLREIKKRYPREEVLLHTAGEVSGLERIAGVERVERKERGYLVRISQVSAAQEILRKAMEVSEVEHFEIKEPTLNQIFIKEVGESNE
ncbi:ATP-binding cassette domain-containing protein [Paenibacillus timonensis]|jgi:ABC-2 type transport system ATP-binding protein|uniref:ABC transporter ATP-binding protein n=1 Tax=Paenibacillus timonensis TaxID=225915 RepID=A0ABW3S9E7_9BACL|nr:MULTISPECIES: ATP-binding cassette domain-containing protein [Paenibacillus]MCH1639608.1 ATP-binding cassette domain-containing protein [Paenibacillus timonensis]MDU2239143.1 ATP-binding cassette domain-containing protein [Paenibacillus sp.]GJM82459.1 putative ABC transporter ATP-binding protein YhaQ [Paenibacillus sp. HMSSN-139]